MPAKSPPGVAMQAVEPRRGDDLWVCVLEWNSGGHHETYLILHARALLACGFNVLILCRDAEGALRQLGTAEPEAVRAGRVRARGIGSADFLGRKRRWRLRLAAWLYARGVVRLLRRCEHEAKVSCRWIHLACLYEHQVMLSRELIIGARRPWTALYLQARAYHVAPGAVPTGIKRDWQVSRLWKCPGLRGLLVLDEGVAPRVAKDAGCAVMAAPDLTDTIDPAGHPLGDEVRRFAAGAPVVGVVGHLIPSKGVVELARLSLAWTGPRAVFLFAGEIYWEMYSPEEAAVVRRAMAETSRIWFHPRRLPDEQAYNAVVSVCDVLVAVYRDFPHSSNTLTKVACFERPLIVAEGHLMARRVREFRLGEVVPEGDAGALAGAITKIVSDPTGWRAGNQPAWAEYRARHSYDALVKAWAELSSVARR